MPMLDVTDVLLDPLFQDNFTVLRRQETVGSNGLSSVTTTTLSATGVVTAGPDNSLERKPDLQFSAKTLTIVTTFRLQGPSPGYQPDLVVWGGDNFIVDRVEDYTRYGAGFVQAQCSSIDSVDQPPGS